MKNFTKSLCNLHRFPTSLKCPSKVAEIHRNSLKKKNLMESYWPQGEKGEKRSVEFGLLFDWKHVPGWCHTALLSNVNLPQKYEVSVQNDYNNNQWEKWLLDRMWHDVTCCNSCKKWEPLRLPPLARPAFPPLKAPVPARRGTAVAATRRAVSCTSRCSSPGLAAPSPRRAPSPGRRGRAAARRGVRRTSRRGGTTRSSRSTGRVRPPGAAAGRPAPRAPPAPAADRWGARLAAGSAAPPRLGTQPSHLRLEAFFPASSGKVDFEIASFAKRFAFEKDSFFHLFEAFFSSISSSNLQRQN